MLLKAASGTRNDGGEQSHLGSDAGYAWHGHVTAVAGSWTVPKILNFSRPGFAGTWVAVVGFGVRRPFVQVGTDELRGYSKNHTAENRYWVFWSDTTRHFHPTFLFRVRPGDTISARLTVALNSLTLTVVDKTTHMRTRFSTSEEAGMWFDEAEWIQEDELNSTTGSLFEYPSLSSVGFNHLIVNADAPSYSSLYSMWSSVTGDHLEPTPLKHDAFVLQRATISSIGYRYQQVVEKWLVAARMFGKEVEQWVTGSSHEEIMSASKRFIASLTSEVYVLQQVRVPASLRSMIRLLVDQLYALRKQAQPPTPISSTALVFWKGELSRDTEAALATEHMIRRTLDLPEQP